MAIINGTNRGDRRDGTSGIDQIYGFAGADRLRGLDGDDDLYGGDGADLLIGGRGNDRLFGGEGVDRLQGDKGDDRLDGGGGIDTAVFSGSVSNYRITRANGVVTVRDLRTDANTGVDTLIDVERARFGDGTLLDFTMNSAPQAGDDTGAVGEDVALIAASVLGDDTDPDGDPLTVSAVNGEAAAVGAEITLASGARLTMQADGTYAYDASGAFESLSVGEAGTDSFTYTASDGLGGSDTATVTITITGANDAPTAPATNGVTTDEDAASAAVAIGAADVDGDALTYSVKSGAEPAKGSVTFDQTAGTFTYTPAADANGADAFTILIADGNGGTVEQAVSVTINPVDEPEAAILLSGVAAGIGGFKILGEDGFDYAGRSVSAAGDVNGDGFADLLVGADGHSGPDGQSGAAYLVYGKADGAAVDLAAVAAGMGGFKIVAEDGGDFAGISVSGAGDVNGDGRPDLLVGASGVGGPDVFGAAYVVFGKANTTLVDLDAIVGGTGGFKIAAEAQFDQAGRSVSGVGDMNGDGLADLLVGALGNDGGGAFSGAAYVVFGRRGGAATDLGAVVAGDGGFKITGESELDFAGFSASGAGDVNGDGRPDLVVGAFGANAAYVVFGKADGAEVDLDAVADGTGGFKITGEAGGDQAGFSVSAAGDVNDDGLDDLIVGAVGNDGSTGAAYVVFGKADGDAVDLGAVAAGNGGFKIVGQAGFDQAGFSVSAAGDVNGDGLDDLLVGAVGNGGGAGAAYLVFGKADGAVVDLDDVAAGTGGLKFTGEAAGDQAGVSVSAAGDVNDDGLADLIVGAYFNGSGGDTSNGAAYVVFGSTEWSV